MDVKCYELKIQNNKLSTTQKIKLHSFFSQAKWFVNDALTDVFNYDFKTKQVTVKWTKDDIEHTEIKELTLPSQVKQALLAKLKVDIQNLAKKKRRGKKVGKLKFKKQVDCIPFIQFNGTWKLGSKKKIHLAGLGYIEVNGKDQIPSDIKEFGPAKLIRKPDGIIIQITCFKDKKTTPITPIESKDIIGLDFGIKDSITLSNGQKFDFNTPIPKSLKRVNKKLSRATSGSKNRFKHQQNLKRRYQRLTNKKNDKANKFVSKLKNQYKLIFMQDENLRGWQAGFFGKQIQQSCLGRIKSKLKKLNTTVMIDKFEPTTKLCPHCGTLNKLALSERIYQCSCGFREDRDIKSAQTCVMISLSRFRYLESVPTERREFKPVEILASVGAEKYSLLFGSDKLISKKQEAMGLAPW